MAQLISECFEMSTAERRELSLRTRARTEAFHGYEVCASQLSALYAPLLAGDVR